MSAVQAAAAMFPSDFAAAVQPASAVVAELAQRRQQSPAASPGLRQYCSRYGISSGFPYMSRDRRPSTDSGSPPALRREASKVEDRCISDDSIAFLTSTVTREPLF